MQVISPIFRFTAVDLSENSRDAVGLFGARGGGRAALRFSNSDSSPALGMRGRGRGRLGLSVAGAVIRWVS
jgi:hypothetical protein